MKNVQLDNDQLERLLDAMNEQLDDVKSDVLSGYGQPKEYEIRDLTELVTVLRVARYGPE